MISYKMKLGLLVLLSIFFIGGLGYLGVRNFVRSIYIQRTCDWANIDNIEMHAHLDIPKIKHSDCTYQRDQNTKLAYFDIDTLGLDFHEYIRNNKFQKLLRSEDVSTHEWFDNKLLDANRMASANLYYTKGSSMGEYWQSILDSANAQLWVTIHYNN